MCLKCKRKLIEVAYLTRPLKNSLEMMKFFWNIQILFTIFATASQLRRLRDGMGENSHAAGWGEGVAEIRHFIRKAFIKRFVLDSQESRKFSKIEIRNEATIDVHGYAVTMTIVIEAVSVCGSVTSSCDSVASAKKNISAWASALLGLFRWADARAFVGGTSNGNRLPTSFFFSL